MVEVLGTVSFFLGFSSSVRFSLLKPIFSADFGYNTWLEVKKNLTAYALPTAYAVVFRQVVLFEISV
jgi:hypothetical protein